jgi:DNA-binding transcriptional ArsR family regulator
MIDQDFVLAPPTVTVGFALEPVHNLINSLSLLNQARDLSGLGPWVERTRSALTPELQRLNFIVVNIFWKVVEPEQSWSDFPSFLEQLASADPDVMRDQAVEALIHKAGGRSADEVLASKASFQALIGAEYARHYSEKGYDFDVTLFDDAYDMLSDAAVMKQTIADYARYMWDNHLRDEWQRTLPMLQESIDAFRQIEFTGMTALQAARSVTGRDLTGIWPELDSARSVVFMPSAHNGPYVSSYTINNTLHLIFGARMPEGARTKSNALSRSELLVRLSALADDTRLQILELLTRHDELCAQDIITLLNLSQSSASRHLRQLTATGYLVERRREVAKCYSLNASRFEDTLSALKLFVKTR